ncbi:hypothetical protein BDQ12DRAFT_666506 [Crucibulum laeve]|uniref:Glutathione S-transferase UstS-like C-terminal domain-containing protein n=1 Tax=Crucibulum laeve TaxID=68775 RepID=A0A5C3M0N5_9AGAR|nr:hypothetical protein BDQ12DRAFT_666506 [Crucibulum laeve]
MITFYDIASTVFVELQTIPYKTEWIEWSDIESVCKRMGIPPSTKKADGSDFYTLPAIYDPSTNTGVSDSLVIAAYLDKTYPNKPTLLPAGTEALHAAFVDAFVSKMGSFRLFLSVMLKRLSPSTVDFFISSRPAILGRPFLGIIPVGDELQAEWKNLEASLSTVDGWYQRNGGGPFIMGDKPTFADFVVGGLLGLGKALSDDIPEWKDVLEWNDRRWKKLWRNTRM